MRVFLTGGTGFIGQPLTRALLARNWHVVALVRNPDSPQARALARMGAELAAGDVTDRESMRGPMAGADLVIHNAGWYEVGITTAAHKQMSAINVNGAENTLGLALELGIPRVVHVSSVAWFGGGGGALRDERSGRERPFANFYEQTKARAHEIALQYHGRGLPVVIVCPANVAGPNDHSVFGYFLRMYLNGMMTPFAWAPETLLSLVHVEDLAEGIALAAERGRIGEAYLLAGEQSRFRDVIALWNKRPGGMKVRFYIPMWMARLISAPMGPLLRLLGLPAFLSAETVATSSVCWNFSSAKAQEELGWTYRPAEPMWNSIIDEELRLRARRKKRDLVSRLSPVNEAD